MNKMYKIAVVGLVGVLLGAGTFAKGAELIPLTADNAINAGAANFIWTFNYLDLSNSVAGSNVTLYIPVRSNSYVECIGAVLDKAFDSGSTNSVTVTIGDGASSNRYLSATAFGLSTPPTWLSPGKRTQAGVTTVIYSNVVTPVVTYSSAITNGGLPTQLVTAVTFAVQTQSVVTAVSSNAGWLVYVTNDTVQVRVSPDSGSALNANTCGAARVFFRILDPTRLR